jgi:hypothetical protein
MKYHLLVVAGLFTSVFSRAQDMLVALDGRQFNVESFRFSADGSMINFHTSLIRMNTLPIDSVLEAVSIDEEKIYRLKRFEMHSPIDLSQVDFLEVVSAGEITVYKRALQMRGAFGGGWPAINAGYSYTYQTEQYFLEREGVLKQVLPADGLSWHQRGLLVKEFVGDDPVSVQEIQNEKFKLTTSSLVDLVEHYNARAYQQQGIGSSPNKYNLFLFKGRNTPTATAEVNGKIWKLDDEPRIIRIPTTTHSKVCVTDTVTDDCKVVQGTGHFPLYFELRWRKSDGKLELIKSNSKRFSRLAKSIPYVPVP